MKHSSVKDSFVLDLQPTLLLHKREGFVSRFEWSPDGAWIAETRPKKDGVRLWSLADGPVAGPIASVPGVDQARWSPDGRGLSVSAGTRIWAYDVGDDGALTQRWSVSCASKACASTAWRPDGGALAIGVGERVVLLDAETGAQTFEYALGLRGSEFICSLEWNHERPSEIGVGTSRGMFGVDVEGPSITIDFGARWITAARWWAKDLVYVAHSGQLIAWNPRRGEAAGQVEFDDYIRSLTLSADRTLAAVMLRGRMIVVRTPEPRYGPEPATLEVVADVTLTGVKKPSGVWAEFHPSAPQLAVHTANGSAIQIYTWDPAQL